MSNARAWLGIVTAALVLAGCGSGGDDGATPPTNQPRAFHPPRDARHTQAKEPTSPLHEATSPVHNKVSGSEEALGGEGANGHPNAQQRVAETKEPGAKDASKQARETNQPSQSSPSPTDAEKSELNIPNGHQQDQSDAEKAKVSGL
jgi:hypothetical protein